MCAQLHFHETIDIKPRMDDINGQTDLGGDILFGQS